MRFRSTLIRDRTVCIQQETDGMYGYINNMSHRQYYSDFEEKERRGEGLTRKSLGV